MTGFPVGMRLATPGDERRLFDLFVTAHAENGWGDMDVAAVEAVIAKAVKREGVAIALIDGPERIEAVIGLQPAKPWHCTDAATNWYWMELLVYVHPLHRRTRHAVKLFQFAEWWEERMKMPVIINLMPRGGFERKDKLFARFGRRIGSSFLIGATGEDHLSEKAA